MCVKGGTHPPPQPSRGGEGLRFPGENAATPVVYDCGEPLSSQTAQARLALAYEELLKQCDAMGERAGELEY